MMSTSKISVYLITYNRLSLLKRAINSVLNQTYSNVELIVVDDHSTDGSSSYLSSLLNYEYDNVDLKIIINSENRGACFSRNLAIQSASGKFITGLDDDDFFEKNRLVEFFNLWLLKEKNTICLFSNYVVIDQEKKRNVTERPEVVTKHDLLYGNYVGNQVFTTIEALRLIDGFDEKLTAWQDLECWYRLLDFGHAQLSYSATYIVDKSHLHERISTKKTKVIIEVYQYVKKKHGLSIKDRALLCSQLIRYTGSISDYIKVMMVMLFMLEKKGAKIAYRNFRTGIKSRLERYYTLLDSKFEK